MEGLEREVRSMQSKTRAVNNELKPVERRIGTLKEHIKHGEYHREFGKVYKQYQQQKPKYQEAFREKFRREITLYEAADRYLKPVLKGHPLNLKKWKAEFVEKTAEKGALYREYSSLKEKTQKVETIKRTVMDILRSDERDRGKNISRIGAR